MRSRARKIGQPQQHVAPNNVGLGAASRPRPGRAAGKLSADVKHVASVPGAAVGGGAGVLAVKKLQEKTTDAAAAELHNIGAGDHDDPASAIDAAAISQLAPRYGLDNLSNQLGLEMKRVYEAYLASVIPSSDEPLQGDEPSKIAAFKDALGIDDAAAAEGRGPAPRRAACRSSGASRSSSLSRRSLTTRWRS